MIDRDKMELDVDARCLQAVAPFLASPTDVRYYLRGVNIEPAKEGVRLVATDGHSLCAVRDPTGSVNEGGLLLSVNKAALPHCKPKRSKFGGKYARLTILSGRLAITDSVGERYIQAGDPRIDGTYPDWKRLLDGDWEVGCPWAFNPKLLARAEKSVNALQEYSRYEAGIIMASRAIDGEGKGGQIMATADNEDIILLLATMRSDRENATEVPSWVRT